jgi:hypothetical protein
MLNANQRLNKRYAYILPSDMNNFMNMHLKKGTQKVNNLFHLLIACFICDSLYRLAIACFICDGLYRLTIACFICDGLYRLTIVCFICDRMKQVIHFLRAFLQVHVHKIVHVAW